MIRTEHRLPIAAQPRPRPNRHNSPSRDACYHRQRADRKPSGAEQRDLVGPTPLRRRLIGVARGTTLCSPPAPCVTGSSASPIFRAILFRSRGFFPNRPSRSRQPDAGVLGRLACCQRRRSAASPPALLDGLFAHLDLKRRRRHRQLSPRHPFSGPRRRGQRAGDRYCRAQRPDRASPTARRPPRPA